MSRKSPRDQRLFARSGAPRKDVPVVVFPAGHPQAPGVVRCLGPGYPEHTFRSTNKVRHRVCNKCLKIEQPGLRRGKEPGENRQTNDLERSD